jgi:hypothetical protein
MNNHADRLRKLCEAASKLPAGEWAWKKNYELDYGECHWAISTPESAKDGRVLDTHTVLFGGPCEVPPDYGPPEPSPIMRLWTDAANARATLALAARIVEASKELREADAIVDGPPLTMWQDARQRAIKARESLDALLRQWASDTGTGEDKNE